MQSTTLMCYSVLLVFTTCGGTSSSVSTEKGTPIDLLRLPSRMKLNGIRSSQKTTTMMMKKMRRKNDDVGSSILAMKSI